MAEDSSPLEVVEENEYMPDSEIQIGNDIDEPQPIDTLFNGDTTDYEGGNVTPDVISEVLRSKNINPDAINIQDEDGSTTQVKFSDLSKQEQIDILSSQNNFERAYDLSDDEIDLINHMRRNNLSSRQFVEGIRNDAQNQILDSDLDHVQVDNMSDDEVFVSDLLARFPTLTDDEVSEALQLERANPQVYQKKIESLREDIKRREEDDRQQSIQIKQEQQRQQYEQFANDLINSSAEAANIGEFCQLGRDDVNDAINFILSEDNRGNRYITQALSEPDSLIKMAWFYLHGEEAIDELCRSYEKQIKDLKKQIPSSSRSTNNGYSNSRVVTKPKQKENTSSDYSNYLRSAYGPGFN